MRIAEGEDAEERLKLASGADVAPEILYYLAEDEDPRVRLAVARNPGTPRHADSFLARDGDVDIRSELAGKIARLTPDLNAEQRDTIRKMTIEVLETLARDEMTRVRSMISATLKDVPMAPPEVVSRVIETLARDADIEVSGPLLENSPLLSDTVLLEIIDSPPVQGAVSAISRRWEVSTEVSDAIIDTDEEPAIVSLLRNESAQIREETLDRLIETAASRPGLHEPLVRRPRLSSANAVKLAKFVAVALAALSLRSGLEEPVVHSLISSRNAKAMTALAWKAELNMGFALQLQLRLGNIEARSAIRPNQDGQFPLSEEDMNWQIDLVAEEG